MEIEKTKFFVRDNIRLLLGLAVVIFFSILIVSILFGKNFGNNKDAQVSINEQNFEVSVAETESEKQIGLSNTEVLGANEGMLFVFEKPAFYSFWMKNMKFPIDIIFIRGDKVTTVISNIPVPTNSNNLQTYQPNLESDKVLEINAGLANKYGIKEGATINIDNF